MANLKAPDDLVQLQRAALAAQAEALREGYTAERWRPWVEAAAAVQAAITERAATNDKVTRYELEMAVKLASREAAS